jgi:hypothetical protein
MVKVCNGSVSKENRIILWVWTLTSYTTKIVYD